MRLRYLIAVLLGLAAVAFFAGQRLLRPSASIHAATTTVPQAQSYLVILGVGSKTPTPWDGSITATGATILSLQGWRFSGSDSISGTSWKLSTREAPPPPLQTQGPFQENGVIVTVSASTSPVSFDVKTAQGNFSFSSQDVPFGVTKLFLNGTARVAQTAAPFQLTTSDEEEDFPSMAQSGDDVYLAYTRFVHGDRSLAQSLGTKTPITNFSFLARPTGMDQVLLLHYSKSQRVWTGPFAVTNPVEDVMRTAVAIDGQGRAWVFYSTQRNGNFDIYARNSRADGTMSAEIRLTTDPGTDLFPVAATDSSGRVWVAWQGFRNNNLEVLASAQTGDTFTPEAIVSTSPASDWDPAIATAPDGEVAISWDTYDKGDYDVYVRRVQIHRPDRHGRSHPHRRDAELRGSQFARLRSAEPPMDRLRGFRPEVGQGLRSVRHHRHLALSQPHDSGALSDRKRSLHHHRRCRQDTARRARRPNCSCHRRLGPVRPSARPEPRDKPAAGRGRGVHRKTGRPQE